MPIKGNPLMVWGHRGHRHHRYSGFEKPPHENSLQAYQQVLQMAMGLECDVVQSKLGTPHLVHDTTFNGITKYELKAQLEENSQSVLQDRFIYQLTDDEIGQLRLKDGQTIPRLQYLLAIMPRFPERFLYLELKGPNVGRVTVRLLERAIRDGLIKPEQIIFSSYNLPTLQSLRQDVGNRYKISTMLTPDDLALSQMYPNWPQAEQNAYYVPFSLQNLKRADIQEIQPDYLNIECSSLTESALASIHEFYPKTKIVLWCAGEQPPEENGLFLEKILAFYPTKKLFAVVSDFPDMMQYCLAKNGVNLKMPTLEPVL
jgi:glycerophosphoryl diester phosphodiesterase